MNIDRYKTEPIGETEFRFFSEGKNGRFEMWICFEPIAANLFNLAFGLWDQSVLKIKDNIELRNGDMDKILGTVAGAAISFLNYNRGASVAASGRTSPGDHASRTRKYQMGINRPEIMVKFEYTHPAIMKETLLNRKEVKELRESPRKSDYSTNDLGPSRPLSKKAQEMKIFIENNPIPKEFLKS